MRDKEKTLTYTNGQAWKLARNRDLRMKKDTEQSAFIKSEKDRERWIISLSVSPATGSPFLCRPAFLME